MINYDELISRNWLFIPAQLQYKIKKIKILIAGVGMGSVIAQLAVRSGFENLIIADGDVVSPSNLNRQMFTSRDLYKNKAESLASELLTINNNCNIIVLDKFLDSKDIEDLVPNVDLVINTIDFDSIAFKTCHDIVKKNNKIEIFPMNLGFGSGIIVNNCKTKSFFDYFNIDKDDNGSKLKLNLIHHVINSANEKTDWLLKMQEYEKLISQYEYDPQLGISTYLAACFVVMIIIKLLNNQEVRFFPDNYCINLNTY